jgi:hypothetical protein
MRSAEVTVEIRDALRVGSVEDVLSLKLPWTAQSVSGHALKTCTSYFKLRMEAHCGGKGNEYCFMEASQLQGHDTAVLRYTLGLLKRYPRHTNRDGRPLDN